MGQAIEAARIERSIEVLVANRSRDPWA